ncbi:hypothetical protein, partial [Salmonella enterica]|uniref:hypothetical protein n=1 Tax=Salmonella enterica TaxID=28901 RepID=UPI001CB6E1E4
TIFSSDSELRTKDFTLRQGGKRRKGRSIQKYVTDFTSAGNAADAIKNCVQSTKEFAWRP